ncbi:bifunctional (p)ppGpp synthetase/guanosine-3',5'-bis(diphosphate) 3'-pyrophosphohydrolase [Flavobacterium sp. GSP27]|uniref:Bifunctional (P)ppGpp synthetase/guanosine-3',5'-bis(Diphosphate) 3'-pyrophosphohydrolase n=1 Tax=Flavobacterium bomense TaxID=2497483 RepID=A0A3S0PJC9_9FLAO|nr:MULTISPECIES: RelA/SpoT family protein [Flavobacterium]RTY94226.1 bifunctional (p)ppGpp synthetase/guanosine-3',5'-bis(diphosphate) 3'-pyrophosphohydrolase [Flavobacterium sp. GSN2]RTY66196.1 bifunctional (p)ppGpp synthetase/guanosine-3',5'-bis(diphosphate) 3'-pyrophosphohydrolase [Flavobacterium sp. LB2P53]RTY83526.1 bifunctional (p)ppGpp synthetase/guanosine-3',5'-bis(diphosphate) 3'-pyrophosphohydrolase [Flavobacterium sp. LS1P28]RTY84045.1 bifunctional (p)ppGpp synthetase/guanosine-3',5'
MIEIDLEKENKAIAQEYKELLRISYQTLSDEDKKLIRKAFDVSVEAHKEQRRKSGEAYIFHPIAVAKIVASEIGLGATSIAAALLHDVVEDTPTTIQDIERLFNPKVAQIVEGLTKISMVQRDLNVSMQAENFRKMILTLNDDVRVILIKLADRLHNMQTMDSMQEDKQTKIASETLYIYAPLAHRLGLYNIKTKLEDLGLKYTEPAVYNEIVSKIKETKEEQDAYIEAISNILKTSLDTEGIDYIIKGRPKSIYSIRRKMQAQNVSFDEVYDKFALRIVYKSTPHDEKFIAWKIYSIVTDHYRPSPSRLRDWISSPKSTGYEALHITVMGPKGRWIEVQVRSERMDEIAEKGYAAHYKYKNGATEESGLDVWLNLLKEALENSETNAVNFVEDFKMNLYSKEIFVFTPKGEIKSLPKGATSLDFAFSIHSEIGIRTRGTRVNGKLVPLNFELKSGDQIEVITSQHQKPTINWLDYVTTSRAKTKIKNVLNENTKKIGEEGKELLTRKLKHLKITLNESVVNELVNFFKLKTSLDLFYRVGIGAIENQQLKDYAAQKSNTFINFFKNKIKRTASTADEDIHKPIISSNYDMLVFGKEHDKLDYKLSPCCNPIPGDDVFGFVTINEGIKVHKKDCPNAIGMQSNYAYRIMTAKWIDSSQEEFKAIINITGMDVLGLTNQLTKVISNNMHVNIQSISLSTEAGIFHGQVAVIVQNNTILKKLINNIKKIDGIDKVTRVYKT